MEVEPQTLSVPKPFRISAARLALLLLPILSFVCYYAPYITGLAYHHAVLEYFGVPQGLFVQDTADLFVYAYQAVLDISGHWWPFIRRPSVIGIVFWTFLLFGLELVALAAFDRKGRISAEFDRRFKKPWIVVPLLVALMSFCLSMLVVLVPILAFPILSVPKKLGEWGAELSLKKQAYVGCEHETEVAQYCKGLVHEGQLLGAGYVVMVSAQWVALYRAEAGTVILKLGDSDLRPLSPEEFRLFQK